MVWLGRRVASSTTTWTSTPAGTFTSTLSRLSHYAFLFGFLLVSNPLSVTGFTFRFSSSPSQCGPTKVVWTAGTAPYKLLLLPIGFQPEGVETRVIFEKVITTGTETAFTFPFPASSKFVAVMSDATGFGAGGTSPILTVGSSNTSSCLPATPSQPDFYMYLSSPTLTQCSPVRISWDSPPDPPVSIYGVIPQGQSFDFNAAEKSGGRNSFDWTVDVKSGTQFFFVAGDASGSGKGGSTDATNIGSGASSCINANSPSATADSGTGGTGPLPGSDTGGGGGGGGATQTGTGVTTASPSGGGSNSGDGGSQPGDNSGNGNGEGGGDGDGGGNDGGNDNGNGNGNGNDNGSGGGTVVGPFQSTDAANSANSRHGASAGLIAGLVIGLLALCAALFGAFLLYKRSKRDAARQENQRTRLLAASDVSEVHLPSQTAADLPHPRPPYFQRPWAGPSLENLGSTLRVTPFPWPLNRSGSSASPTSPRADRGAINRGADTNANTGNEREGLVTGTTSARPGLDARATSSSSVLRRLRSGRYIPSGFGFGTPSSGGGGSGYRSLGDSGYNTTPSSNPPNRTTNTSSSFFASGMVTGRNTSSDSSPYSGANGPVHKSPLPPYTQDNGQNSRGSNLSQNIHSSSDENPFNDPLPIPIRGGPDDTLIRPDSTPSGPRPLLGIPTTPGEISGLRPGMDRADTGGSVWEVPPTYSSLRRKPK